MVEEPFNQIRYWDGTNDEYQQQQLSSVYHHYPQQYLMTKQNQNNHNFHIFSNSSASATYHNAENSEKVLNDDTPDAVETPQFFDFLGVGAT
jgi:hypothetical protein